MIVVFCLVILCSLVGGYQYFREIYHLHLYAEDVGYILQNNSNHQQDYLASEVLLWKPWMSYTVVHEIL
jgi:hypothetical protein